MKFKSLLFVVGFIPALAMAQAPVIAPPMVEGMPGANGGGVRPANTPETRGMPGSNGGGIRPVTAPEANKAAPAKPKPPGVEADSGSRGNGVGLGTNHDSSSRAVSKP